MSQHARPPHVAPLLPDNAPFSPEQRAWLNGFIAALVAPGAPSAFALAPGEALALVGPAAGPEDDDAPWHDPAMALPDRLALAEGRPLRRRLMAAMAQQDCGQCGYTCEAYADAIVGGAEARLTLCVPGGKDTARAVKKLAADAGAEPAATPAPVAAPPAAPAIVGAAPAPVLVAPGGTRESPSVAAFLSRRRLNGEGSEKSTFHVEMELGPGLAYEAGDSFGLFAHNAPALAGAVARTLGLPLDESISADRQTRSLRDWLMHGRALGQAPDALFAAMARRAGTAAERARLERMAEGEDPDGDLSSLDVLAALQRFPHLVPEPFALIEALDPLQPRLYSISSSPKAAPGRVSLTVDAVRYQVGERHRLGVASTHLSERAEEGDRLRAYVQRAHGFGLPANDAVPIVMVGPGTGVAPFRAFLQERLARGAPGKAWLFYGHQREATDFFYREEMEGFAAAGALTQLSTAWSRDGAAKVYVQDRMRESGAELAAWVDEGAHLYVCGDAKRMAKDVEAALVEVLEHHRGLGADAARARVAAMKREGRYQADVY